MSETATSRHIFAPYCHGLGIDVGFGFDAVVPHALTSDQVNPYTQVGQDKQIFRNDCRNFSFLCDETMDWIHSSHCCEDFPYKELATIIIPEWRRILKPGGLLLTNCPWQQKFLAHCAASGQGVNLAHFEPDFGMDTWNSNVLMKTGSWEIVFQEPNHGPYSWLQIARKIA